MAKVIRGVVIKECNIAQNMQKSKELGIPNMQDILYGANASESYNKNNAPLGLLNERPKTILQNAHDAIYGDKQADYGAPELNLQNIADYWSVHLSASLGIKISLDVYDVTTMMILVKSARLINSPKHSDTIMDIAGYAGLAERCILAGK